MRISHISIENFRSHSKSDLALERFSVLRGSNAAGKTSIEQAIEFAFTGRCEATGANGQGATELIRAGQDKSVVTLQLTNGNGKQRELRASLTRKSGRSATSKGEGGEEFVEKLTRHRNVLSCLCNNRFFVDLRPAEQKDVLASIVLPESYEWPEEMMSLAAEAGVTASWKMPPLEVIDSTYKRAFDLRTEVSRDLKLNPLPEKPADAEEVDVPGIKQRLEGLQTELDQARATKATLKHNVQSYEHNLRNAKTAIQRVDEQLDSEQRAHRDAKSRTLPKKDIERLQKLAAKDSTVRDLNERIARLNGRTEELDAQRDRLKAIVSYCPTCSQEVSAEFMETSFSFIAEQREKVTSEVDGLYQEQKGIGDPEDAKRQIAAHEQAVKEMERHGVRITELQADVKKAKESLAELELAKADAPTSDLDETIATLTERIAKGMTKLTEASGLAASVETWKKAFERRQALEIRSARLDKLVEYFGPKGVKAELIEKHIGGFTNLINETLERWGYSAHLSIEPYSFLVGRLAGGAVQYRELALLSKSERYRFAVAFQVALAIVSGFRFVVVDEMDIFDQTSRTAVNRALYSAADLDTVIVLATDQRTEAPDLLPGSTFIMLSLDEVGSTTAKVLATTPAVETVAA